MALYNEVKTHNNKQAEPNGKILLIDADTICFHSILGATETEELLGENFYSEEAWKEIITQEGYDEETGTLRTVNLNMAKEAFFYKVESLMMATGCEKYELYLTGWLPTFRHYLDPKYKSDRKGKQRPLRLHELKWWLVQEHEAKISGYFEADELLADRYLRDRDNCIVTSVDKDLLLQLPGKHFDYYHNRFKFVETTEYDAIYNFHHRLLTGDRGDYIITGLTRVGPKTAEKILYLDVPVDSMSLDKYTGELAQRVEAEYGRQDCPNLNLMYNMVGCDYMNEDGTLKIPYHTDGVQDSFLPMWSDFDTHLIKNGQVKSENLMDLYKQVVSIFASGKIHVDEELLDLERFALFTSYKRVLDEKHTVSIEPLSVKLDEDSIIFTKEIS